MRQLSSTRYHAHWAAGVAAVGIMLASLYAQSPAPATPRFEAASIKRNTSGTGNTARNTGAGGRLVFENFTLRELITAAYDVQSFQVLGGPDWTTRDRFDVQAAAAAATPMPELNRMLRALLAERFALRVRVEQRDLPRFTLTRARQDGRLGPGLKVSSVDCGPSGRGHRSPDTPPGPIAGCSAWISPTSIAFQGQPMSALTDVLGRLLERPVIDQTGLAARYDFELKFAPEAGQPPAADSAAASVFAAMQEQLGLKLESGRGAVDVVMIESVEPPTSN